MSTRREFIKRAGAAAGVVFCGCWMHEAARAGARRRAAAGHGRWQAGQNRRCAQPLLVS
jgi:hypothetical protein